MARRKSRDAELAWSFARLGYDVDTIATISYTIGVDPYHPPYPVVSLESLPKEEEIELLVVRVSGRWMKIRAYISEGQIAYLAYRNGGETDMPNGLAAIRLQCLDSGLLNPPIREPLNMCTGKFITTYKLPELSEWDRQKAREWLESQNTPGTALYYLHERAVENNSMTHSWVPAWLRLSKDLLRQGPIPVAHIQRMAEEVDRKRFSYPEMDDTRDLVVPHIDDYAEPKKPGWLSRLFGKR